MNAKKLKASHFPNMKGGIVESIRSRGRLYVKYKLGLNWVYMKGKELGFNRSVDVEDGFKAPTRLVLMF